MARIYALHDSSTDLKKQGAFEISTADINKYNKQGYGIFWVLNDFEGARKQENVTKINYWICDIDEGTKEEQLKRIEALNTKPTFIIETKKGFHCYWKVKGNATQLNYKKIVQGIINRLKGDNACKDCSRLLRHPMTYHLKDPKNPFYIEFFDQHWDREYTEQLMLVYFAEKTKKKVQKTYTNDDSIEGIKRYAKSIVQGDRNNFLHWALCRLIDNNMEIENNLHSINAEMPVPLDEAEINQLIRGKKRC